MSGIGLDAALAAVREGLVGAAREAESLGLPAPPPRGHLIRPLAGYVAARRMAGGAVSDRLWRALFSVQLAHEASLVHDDIVDGCATRRGEPSVVAARGVGAAVVAGDHYLTAAYRLAVRTGSLAFADVFARAVERTVAAEVEHGAAAGQVLGLERYGEVVLGKSGELLGCAMAAAPVLAGAADADRCFELGRRMGLLYQMVDDLLDYCPAAGSGKPALGDYAQRRWTWPLDELPGRGFGGDAAEIVDAFHADGPGGGPARRCLARLDRVVEELLERVGVVLGEEAIIRGLLIGWRERAHEAVERQASHGAIPAPTRSGRVVAAERAYAAAARGDTVTTRAASAIAARIRERVPDASDWAAFLGRHSRSFRFAARLFLPGEAERVGRVYAYCRATDDLVDCPAGEAPEVLEAMLTEWLERSRRAYQGRTSGLGLVDRVMGEMAGAGVPFGYAAELVEGMRMDLRRAGYETLVDLRVYTYRVASVVGLWLTELFGVHDPAVLARAAQMGHAMQLTNLLRDVGEDWRAGRLYLPAALLYRHGLDASDVGRMCRGQAEIGPGYVALVEELMAVAEEDYRQAFRAIPRLPPSFQRPVAVAAHVYRGIHAAIRRNGYDNLNRRAYTTGPRKLALAAGALRELHRERKRSDEPAQAAARPGPRRVAAASSRARSA